MTISKSQVDELIKGVRADLVQQLLSERRDDLQLLTPAQVCGIFNVTAKTLDSSIEIPQVTLIPGVAVRYLASDVAKFIESRRK